MTGTVLLIVAIAAGAALVLFAILIARCIIDAFRPAPPRVSRDRILVAAVGDSNTYGTGVLFKNRKRNSYPAQLERLLGPKYQVLNFGVSGRTLVDSGDLPYRVNRFFALSHEVEPAIVLVMLGTNDAKPQNWNAERYQRELLEFVASYQALPGHPAVYLLAPPAAWANRYAIDPEVVTAEVVPIAKRVAATAGVVMVDIFEATAAARVHFPDGIHPDAAGYELMAHAVHQSLLTNR